MNVLNQDKRRINYREEFELCYLRHRYVRRSNGELTAEKLAPYMGIVLSQARKTVTMNLTLFCSVGLSLDDVVNIGRVHTMSFLSLFAMETMPCKLEAFSKKHEVNKGRTPTFEDLADKNKANFTLFIKQRFEDLVRVCRQKSRNVEGIVSEDYMVFSSERNPPKYLRPLLTKYASMGFKKIDPSAFRAIKKRARPDNPGYFHFEGLWYVVVKTERARLQMEDITTSVLNPYDLDHNLDPESRYMEEEVESEFKEYRKEYKKMDSEDKAQLIRFFIEKNKNDPGLKKELLAAERILKRLG